MLSSWNIWAIRMRRPYITIQQLPAIDIVLLSHAHMDHMHPYSCKAIFKHSKWITQFIVAPWVNKRLSRHLHKQTHQLDWAYTTEIWWVSITACEVNHWWARYPWTSDRSKWHNTWASYNAYLLEKNWKKIFFWWDTAYTDAMKLYTPVWWVDVAIMPIWSYDLF
jgi:L-ascorbate metabolism protein UlaG (beta-lactamase superfamily)